jgi:hypothetical protein
MYISLITPEGFYIKLLCCVFIFIDSATNCTLILLEMGGACSTNGGRESCVQGSGGET